MNHSHPKLASGVVDPQLCRKVQARWRLGAWAFLCAVAIQGFPIGRTLSESVMLSSEAGHLRRLEAAGEIGLEKSMVSAIVWGLIYLLPLISIIRHGQKSFVVSIRYAAPYYLLVFLVPISALWSSNPLDVVMNAGHTMGVVFVSFCAAMYYYGDTSALLRHVSIILGINVLLNLMVSWFLPSYGISFDGRWRGFTTNSNTLALISGSTFVINFLSYFYQRGIIRKTNLAILLMSSVSLVFSGSVTVMVCTVFSIFLVLVLTRDRRISRNFLFLFFAFVPVISVFFVLFASPLIDWFLPFVGKSSTLSGRTIIWDKALEAISAKPLLGWGWDDRGAVIEYVYLTTLHFHNGYLDVAVRGGFLGLTLLIFSIVSLISSCQRFDIGARVTGLTVIFFLCLYNLSEVTFLAPRNLLWILFSFMVFYFIPRNSFGYIR